MRPFGGPAAMAAGGVAIARARATAPALQSETTPTRRSGPFCGEPCQWPPRGASPSAPGRARPPAPLQSEKTPTRRRASRCGEPVAVAAGCFALGPGAGRPKVPWGSNEKGPPGPCGPEGIREAQGPSGPSSSVYRRAVGSARAVASAPRVSRPPVDGRHRTKRRPVSGARPAARYFVVGCPCGRPVGGAAGAASGGRTSRSSTSKSSTELGGMPGRPDGP